MHIVALKDTIRSSIGSLAALLKLYKIIMNVEYTYQDDFCDAECDHGRSEDNGAQRTEQGEHSDLTISNNAYVKQFILTMQEKHNNVIAFHLYHDDDNDDGDDC